MKAPAGQTNVERVSVLTVGLADDDQTVLRDIFRRSDWALCRSCQFSICPRANAASALAEIRARPVPVVLCDEAGRAESWKEMLEQLVRLPKPPCLIVTSRVADEYLWAEALNLGAWDVLVKPFDRAEVERIVSLAWLHWKGRRTQSAGAAEFPAGARRAG